MSNDLVLLGNKPIDAQQLLEVEARSDIAALFADDPTDIGPVVRTEIALDLSRMVYIHAGIDANDHIVWRYEKTYYDRENA